MVFFEKNITGQMNNFSHNDLLQYVESLLKESSAMQPPERDYTWLKARHIHHFSQDLESFKPLVVKMTPESCAAIAVKLDNLTAANVTAAAILTHFERLLREEQSMRLMAENVARAKGTGRRKRNRVRPQLGAGRTPVVSFILD